MDRLEQRRIVAELIKYELKETDKSLSALAESYGSTRQNFSRIIRMEADLNPKIINFILENTSGAKFDFSESVYEKTKAIFYDAFDAFFYYDSEKQKAVKNEIRPEYYYSFGLPYYILAIACNAAQSFDGEKLHECIEVLNEIRECIPYEDYDCYQILVALDHALREEFRESYEACMKIENKRLNVYGLQEEMLSNYFCEIVNPLEGFEHMMNALRVFQTRNCYVRAVAITENKGIYFMQMGLFEKAVRCFEETQKQAALYHRNELSIACDSYICFSYFLMGNYEKTITYAPQLYRGKYWDYHIMSLFWSHYFRKEYEECVRMKDLMKLCHGNKKINIMMAELMGLYLEHADISLKEKKINDVIGLQKQMNMTLTTLFLLKLLASEYRRNNDSEKLAVVQRRIIDELQFDMLLHESGEV